MAISHTSIGRTLLRRRAVQERTGLARSTLYQLIARGRFPKPIQITDKAVAWPSDAVDQWIAERIASGV